VRARPLVLSLLTMRRCTAACDHCAIGGHPRARGMIPVPRLHALIDEAAKIPSFERVVFSGGECFLLRADLDRLVAHATARGFATRAITNAYWAVSAEAARTRVAAVRAAGLGEMMISTGTFHQRYVPVERVLFAARAAAAAGIAVRVSVEECDQSDFDHTGIRGALAAEIEDRRVTVSSDPWITDAGGRGTTHLTHERRSAQRGGYRGGSCSQILTVVTVTPEQRLTACCGFPTEELPALDIGSVADTPLDELLDDAPDVLLQMWLHVAGPERIAAFVARHVPGFALAPAVSICEACVSLQRDPRAMRAIADHGAAVAGTVARSFLQRQRLRTSLGAT
jgi:hypothetical protein